MANITFITGNQNKADYLGRYIGHPVDHVKLELDEIQSLDLSEIAEHKARQAYAGIKKPVLVEDQSLELTALGRLPGPFIKWFLEELGNEGLISLVDGKDRGSIARTAFGYFDGKTLKLFESSMPGSIAREPAGDGGFGWDNIFIPKGYRVTRASLGKEDYRKTYLRIKPIMQVKEFLESLD